MAEVVSVRFHGGSKNYYFDPKGLTVQPDEYIVVETAQGLEYVRCVEGNHEVSDQSVVQPLRPVLRIATAQDEKIDAENKKKEKEAFDICTFYVSKANFYSICRSSYISLALFLLLYCTFTSATFEIIFF